MSPDAGPVGLESRVLSMTKLCNDIQKAIIIKDSIINRVRMREIFPSKYTTYDKILGDPGWLDKTSLTSLLHHLYIGVCEGQGIISKRVSNP